MGFRFRALCILFSYMESGKDIWEELVSDTSQLTISKLSLYILYSG